jgi:hypothetical protein
MSTRPLLGATRRICSRNRSTAGHSPDDAERGLVHAEFGGCDGTGGGLRRDARSLGGASAQARDLHGLAQHVQQVLRVGRLGDEVERAALAGLHGVQDGALARDHDHRGVRGVLADAHKRIEAVLAGHAEVQQHGIPAAFLQRLVRLLRVRGFAHLVALVLQHAAQLAADRGVVVHGQYGEGLSLRHPCSSEPAAV